MTRFLLIFFTTLLSCNIAKAEPFQINDKSDLPPSATAMEVRMPDGELYMIASGEADLMTGVQGLTPSKAKRIAQRTAALKAKKTLTAFIHGSTFESTDIVGDEVSLVGGNGEYREYSKNKIVEEMRKSPLRAAEVLQVKVKDDLVTVTVGVSARSIRTSNKFRQMLENINTPSTSNTNYSKASIASNSVETRNYSSNNTAKSQKTQINTASSNNNSVANSEWVHPMLR